MTHPYRSPAPPHDGAAPARRDTGNGGDGLWLLVALYWALSTVRVVAAFTRGEVFAAEATIALAVAVVVPALAAARLWRAVSSLGRWRSRRGSGAEARGSARQRP